MPIMASSRSDDDWVKPRELAAREGIARSTLWRWIEKGIVEAKRRHPRTGVRVRVAGTRADDDDEA